MNYYFVIPKKDVTREQLNCSASRSVEDLRVFALGTWFKTDHVILKVTAEMFERVPYFDKYQAYELDDIKKFIEENEQQEVLR